MPSIRNYGSVYLISSYFGDYLEGKTSSLCAKIYHIHSLSVAMHAETSVRMHGHFENNRFVRREQLCKALSLDLASISEIIVHFYSFMRDQF